MTQALQATAKDTSALNEATAFNPYLAGFGLMDAPEEEKLMLLN